jgi:hypothetical protein
VFGPEAKTRVWLVLDGDVLYVDRNGNGDLTEDGERVPLPKFEKAPHPAFAEQREAKAGDLPDGKFRHTGLVVYQARMRPDYQPKDPQEEAFMKLVNPARGGLLYMVGVNVERRWAPRTWVEQQAGMDPAGCLRFADRPQDAPVIHFDGPLTMGLAPGQALVRGAKPGDLAAHLGTPGVGAGTFAAFSFERQKGFVPDDVHPLAEVEFPAAAGKAPLRTKVVLAHRC